MALQRAIALKLENVIGETIASTTRSPPRGERWIRRAR
jgi:hypothetical protein